MAGDLWAGKALVPAATHILMCQHNIAWNVSAFGLVHFGCVAKGIHIEHIGRSPTHLEYIYFDWFCMRVSEIRMQLQGISRSCNYRDFPAQVCKRAEHRLTGVAWRCK